MQERGGFDVVVLGGGMAGLCTAVAALETGARTLVLERAGAPGGSMRLSGGTIWTAPSMAVMETWVPGGSRARQRQLVDGLRPGLAWLARHGVPARATYASERQVGVEVDVDQLTACLVKAIERRGGVVRTGESLDRFDPAGPAVVLATGGFGASESLRREYLGPGATGALVRSNPHSVGDGLRLALAAGGRPTRSMATVYGHTMPGLPADPSPAEWVSVTQYATQDGVLLDLDGRRFFDESRSMQDEVAASQIVTRRDGRAFFVVDRRIHDDEPVAGRSPARTQPNFARAVAAGAPHVEAPTLEALADGLGRLGVDGSEALATLRAFNAAVVGDAVTSAALDPPRARSRIAVLEPPFHALEVRAGITFTLGGIDVDDDLRVLGVDGEPVAGLFAAGADAGGTYDDGYMGGLVLGLVQGRIAGRNAARFARDRVA